MSKPEIDVLDEGDAYPYSSHIRVEETELQIGDLLLVFESEDSNVVNFFERVYGFTWPGIVTHSIDGPVPAEFRDFQRLAEGFESREIVTAPKREQSSFLVEDRIVRSLTLYRYVHGGGMQPILVDERRDPLEKEPFEQEVFLCENAGEVIETLFEEQSLTDEEASHVRQFLLDAGYQDEALPEAEE